MRASYRPEIDGLRAVSILLVMFFHIFPGTFPGGYLGVDVFFVISGFVITSACAARLAEGSFSIREFYLNRVRRIFPSLGLSCLLALAAGWFLLTPADLTSLSANVLHGLSLRANLFFGHQGINYFDSVHLDQPFLNLWSLAVEEQYYLVFPVLVSLCFLVFRKRLRLALIALLLAAAGYPLLHHEPAQENLFYLTRFRIWEILFGAAIFHVPGFGGFDGQGLRLPPGWARFLRGLLGVLGLLLIVGPALSAPSDIAPHFKLLLLPVLGAALVIASGTSALSSRYLLSLPPMIWLGRVSYALYLIHWPILSFIYMRHGEMPRSSLALVVIAVAVCAAGLLYHFVELPIRGMRDRAAQAVLACAFLAVPGVLAFEFFRNEGFPARYPAVLQELRVAEARYANSSLASFRSGKCFLNEEDEHHFSPECTDVSSSKGKIKILLWGSSHAADLYPGFRTLDRAKYQILEMTYYGCTPYYGEECAKWLSDDLGMIAKMRPDYVLLPLAERANISGVIRMLAPTIVELKKLGVRNVILVGPQPHWKHKLVNTLGYLALSERLTTIPRRVSYRLTPLPFEFERQMRNFAREQGVRYFSLLDQLCDMNGCLVTTGASAEDLITVDSSHFTENGSAFIARKFQTQVLLRETGPN